MPNNHTNHQWEQIRRAFGRPLTKPVTFTIDESQESATLDKNELDHRLNYANALKRIVSQIMAQAQRRGYAVYGFGKDNIPIPLIEIDVVAPPLTDRADYGDDQIRQEIPPNDA